MSEAYEANSDPKLNQKLQQSDADALSEMDAPLEPKPEEIPARVEKIVKEIKEEDAPKEKQEGAPPPPPEPKEDEDLDAKLNEVQPKKNAHPNTAKGYEVLKGVAKEERLARKEAEKQAKELKEKLDALETEYKGKVLTPEIEKDYEDLREMRRTFQIENDPEFKAKYNTKLQEIDARALGILREEKMSPQVEKFITDNGGVVAMYSSTQRMPKPYQDQTYREFIEETIAGKLSGISKNRFEQALGAALDLKDEMSREIALAKEKGSERQQRKQKELEDLFRTSADATRKSFGKMAEKLDYPKDASKEDKIKIDQHNERVVKAEKIFSEYMKSGNDPAKLAEAMARAAHSQMLIEEMQEKDGELESRDKKIKDLEEKIEKMKKSGETGKITSAPPPSSQPTQTGKFISDDAALKDF